MVFSKPAASMLSLMAALLVANVAWSLGHELSETKEQLKLEYDLSVTDHGTGRVTLVLPDGSIDPTGPMVSKPFTTSQLIQVVQELLEP